MYSAVFKYLLNPLYEKGVKRRRVLDYRRMLEDSQWWTAEKIRTYQWEQLTGLLRHAALQAPHWRDIFRDKGLSPEAIRGQEDFRRLPVTTKAVIRADKNRMIADNHRGKTWTKATGGSTGVPLELDYTPLSYDWRTAVTKRGYGWAGCEDGVKQVYIWGTAIGKMSFKQKLKEDLHHAFLRQKYFNCFQFTEDAMAVCLKKLNHFRPSIIVGYTNPLYHFALFIKKHGQVRFRPRGIITAAEKLHPYQREVIHEVFNCPVFNTYGSREFMLIASECPRHHGMHIHSENLLVEIIKEDGTPAAPGESGELVITDLHNWGMPFIRYQIGDMAVATDRFCPCGRGLPLLQDVVGRSLDMIRTPDGRFVPGEFFPHLMKEFSGIERFQIVQKELKALHVKLVKNAAFKTADFHFMRNEINKVMGADIVVHFDFVDDIPLTRTGKYRVTVCQMEQNARAE
jgi:phenylacetate-CoA ligase